MEENQITTGNAPRRANNNARCKISSNHSMQKQEQKEESLDQAYIYVIGKLKDIAKCF